MAAPTRLACTCRRVLTAPFGSRSVTSSTSSSSTPVQTHDGSPLTHWRITLLRSPIKLQKPYHEALRVLGLRRRMAVVYREHNPTNAGLILKVKELLRVENVTQAEYEAGVGSTRRLVGDDRGYRVVGNIYRDRVEERRRVLAEMDEDLARRAA